MKYLFVQNNKIKRIRTIVEPIRLREVGFHNNVMEYYMFRK